MKKVKVLLLVLILITSVSSVTMAQSKNQNQKLEIKNQEESKELSVDEYWEELKKKADELYGKANLSVEISTILYEDGEYGGEAKMEVPIFNGDRRKKIKEEQMDFLNQGAELLNELEVALDSVEVLREKETYLRALIATNGARSIDAYHDVREELVKIKAEINKIKRKLEVMLM